MKQVLTIALLIIGMTGMGQNLYIREVMAYDTYTESSYLLANADYDDNWNVTAYRRYQSWGDTIAEYIFSNDTLVKINYSDLTRYLVHDEDTIKVYSSSGDEEFYVVNEDYQITKGNDNLQMVWNNDDMIELYNYGDLVELFSYTSNKNPYYNIFKTFRGYHNASFHQIEEIVYLDSEYSQTWVVRDELYNYPTEVDFYIEGEHAYTYYYDYYIVTDIPVFSSDPGEVLSINFYDITGRKIEKPKRGFYIERKQTNRGVVTTKHFTP